MKPPWTSETSTIARTERLRQPNVRLASSTRFISPGIAEAVITRGVKPMSCIVFRPTTKTAASSAARTRNGQARLTLPSRPPPTVPTSIAAPDTIAPRAKTRSSWPS